MTTTSRAARGIGPSGSDVVAPDPENFARLDADWTGDPHEAMVREAAQKQANLSRAQRRHGDDFQPPERWERRRPV